MIIFNRSLPPGQSKADIPSTLMRLAQRGFTLIELMIAMAIGLLIVLALTTLFVNISRTNNEMAKTNAQIENGRFAIQLLESDIVHGGYWGGYVPQFDDLGLVTVPGDVPNAVPDPCKAYATWIPADTTNLIGIPVQSYDDDGAPAVVCSAIGTNKKANTDMLVVRHAETCLPGVGNCEADIAGKLYFQSSSCELEIAAGLRYILDTTGFSLNTRKCVGTGVPQALPIITSIPSTIADKRKFISSIYYVSDINGTPTLMRSSFDDTAHQAAVPLIEGIEGFRVELGVDVKSRCGNPINYLNAISRVDPATCLVSADTAKNIRTDNRGDGTPETFVHCPAAGCTVDQLTNVVAVKLYVLARNREESPGYTDTKTYQLGTAAPLGPFNDRYKRHVYSTTVRLTNISARRETP